MGTAQQQSAARLWRRVVMRSTCVLEDMLASTEGTASIHGVERSTA